MSPFKGGRIGRRDSWHGFEHREGFADFKRWYHRVVKTREGSWESLSAEGVREAFEDGLALGRPKAK